jgi:hypothetical protein
MFIKKKTASQRGHGFFLYCLEVKCQLIVFCSYLEVSLRVRTDRANFGRSLANYDMAAVGALPYSVAVLGEYQVAFYVCKQLSVSFFVFLFNCRNAVEQGSDIVEA